MVRSIGIAAVVVGLAWTGLSLAQPSSPMPASASAPTERYITVPRRGQTAPTLQIAKNMARAERYVGFQVQVVGTGGDDDRRLRAGGRKRRGECPRASSTGAETTSRRSARRCRLLATPGTPRVRVTSPTAQPAPEPDRSLSGPGSRGVAAQHDCPPRHAFPDDRDADRACDTFAAAPGGCDAFAQHLPPLLPQPFPTTSTSQGSKPTTVIVTPPPSRDVKSIPVSSVPVVKPTVIPVRPPPPQTFEHPPSTAPQPLQPRLTPSAAGTIVSQAPCNACCQTTCTTCCPSPCNACCQSSCRLHAADAAIVDSSALQRVVAVLRSRLPAADAARCHVQTNNADDACNAHNTDREASTEPAQPRRLARIWGKVEPWKGATQADAAKPVDVPVKRVARRRAVRSAEAARSAQGSRLVRRHGDEAEACQ